MSNIQTKLKTIVFTAISAAILSACGGGGGGGSSALSTGATPTNNTGNSAGNNGNPANNSNANTPKAPSTTLTNSADNLAKLTDEAPIDPANVSQPLHTHFISSKGAQQSNPNVQIRRDATGKMFQTDNQDRNQNGLISSIDFNSNDEVKMDGVVLFNKTTDGNATQPTWTSYASVIAKVYSKGNTQTDVSEQTGKEKNTEFAYGKSTLDDKIAEDYKKLKAEEEKLEKEFITSLDASLSPKETSPLSFEAVAKRYVQTECLKLKSSDKTKGYYVKTGKLLDEFFKDHCSVYTFASSGKRPIYWLFDRGKQNGFKALIYLHRYNADTIGNLRIDYLHRMQRIYESESSRMQDTIEHSTNAREVATATKRREKLQKQFDQF